MGREARAYAEYRMFSAVSRFGGTRDRLSVHIGRSANGGQPTYRCTAALELDRIGRIRAHASGTRLYAAVDAAAELLATRVARRLSAGRPCSGA